MILTVYYFVEEYVLTFFTYVKSSIRTVCNGKIHYDRKSKSSYYQQNVIQVLKVK